MPAHQRVDLGICQAPEGRGIFPGMTVIENLEMGAYTRKDRKTRPSRPDLERVFDLFPRLRERRTPGGRHPVRWRAADAGDRPGADGRPRLLLLDEPSMGLAPMLVQQIFTIVTEINQQGTTVLLVEQNAQQALQRADRAYVLETGRIVRTDEARCSSVTNRYAPRIWFRGQRLKRGGRWSVRPGRNTPPDRSNRTT